MYRFLSKFILPEYIKKHISFIFAIINIHSKKHCKPLQLKYHIIDGINYIKLIKGLNNCLYSVSSI